MLLVDGVRRQPMVPRWIGVLMMSVAWLKIEAEAAHENAKVR
jgi:hypothetical protein